MEIKDLLNAYRQMYRSRLFEEHVIQIWNDGLITGEMHTGIGEEGINSGVVCQLTNGDALALDHRPTSPSIIRGVNPGALLLEFLGHPGGLCSGMGGHMHLFSQAHLLASSGIVGASGPAALGFALAAQHLKPGKIAVAFLGEGAVNQGMMMESFNMASVLKLPVLFGRALTKREGSDISIVSLGVGVHRSLEAAQALERKKISAEVIDLRTLVPLDTATIINSVYRTGRLLVVDEDYKQFGLSGELAALALEHSLHFKYGRVCTEQSIPYSHSIEKQILPGTRRIIDMALKLMED